MIESDRIEMKVLMSIKHLALENVGYVIFGIF